MQPRAIELMQHIAREAGEARAQIPAGVFLTGGGAMVRGLSEIAEQVFDAPTRLGCLTAEQFGGLIDEVQTPEWAVVGGLAFGSMRLQIREDGEDRHSPVRKVAEWFDSFRSRFK